MREIKAASEMGVVISMSMRKFEKAIKILLME